MTENPLMFSLLDSFHCQFPVAMAVSKQSRSENPTQPTKPSHSPNKLHDQRVNKHKLILEENLIDGDGFGRWIMVS